jgi:hypothetical protein
VTVIACGVGVAGTFGTTEIAMDDGALVMSVAFTARTVIVCVPTVAVQFWAVIAIVYELGNWSARTILLSTESSTRTMPT